MPEISRFYGIVIKMFHNDHQPPHFHAEHGGDQMIVAIETLAVIAGKLRPLSPDILNRGAAAMSLGQVVLINSSWLRSGRAPRLPGAYAMRANSP